MLAGPIPSPPASNQSLTTSVVVAKAAATAPTLTSPSSPTSSSPFRIGQQSASSPLPGSGAEDAEEGEGEGKEDMKDMIDFEQSPAEDDDEEDDDGPKGQHRLTLISTSLQQQKLSDVDSVCADIDRWACSSQDDGEENGSSGSARMQELEAEQERLSESVLALSTQFAQVQFRIQQIARAPADQRDEMLRQLQEFASRSCPDLGQLKSALRDAHQQGERMTAGENNRSQPVRHLIGELREQLTELEQFAWQNGQLGPGELPLSELRERQRLVLERVRDKMRLQLELAGPETTADAEQFRAKLEEGLERALEPIREKDQLVKQLRTQIVDLERYVQLLQREVAAVGPADEEGEVENGQRQRREREETDGPVSPSKRPLTGQIDGPTAAECGQPQQQEEEGGWLARMFGGFGSAAKANRPRRFERNELKQTPAGNHYGDQRAEMELAVHELAQVLGKHLILSVDREERAQLSVDELNQVVMDGGQEAIVSSVRKRLCPALKALLEHGLRPTVASTVRGSSLMAAIGCLGHRTQQLNSRYLRPADLAKFDGRKLEHIWDVLTLFLEVSRALEMRDAVVGQLSDAFKLDSVSGKTATSKQILLSTIEHITSSHGRLRRSADTMWKAFVCAALNRNRLPAWIRIIFRSQLVLSKCYLSWSYVARTGVEDIRPLLEGLHRFNFDLPVDLAVRPFEHIQEAFG